MLRNNFAKISNYFEDIKNNLNFLQDRRISHTEYIQNLTDSFYKLFILKILLITIISFVQIFLITNVFNEGKNSYPNQRGYNIRV